MRANGAFIVSLCLLLFSCTVWSAETSRSQLQVECRSDIDQLKKDAKSAVNDIDIIRRDQINYRIEKDLLKETYSSNLQSINLIITIVFGIFGVLGYLGMKSIKEIKADYATELDSLKKLKIQFEIELQTLSDRQKEFEIQVTNLGKVNEEQNTRLKVLELIEKTSSLMSGKQWKWALHWISAGLEMDPKNIILLNQKAHCLGQFGDIASAIETRKLLLELEPGDALAITNLLEALALGNQHVEFYKIYEVNKHIVDERFNGNLTVFLKILLAFIGGELEQGIQMLSDFVQTLPSEAAPLLETWSFDEANAIIAKMPEGKQSRLLQSTIQLFSGKTSASGITKILKEQIV